MTETPDPTAVIAACDIADARTADLPQAPTPAADTLPEWLYNRFAKYRTHAPTWGNLTDEDQSYWAHEAAAVRRAVACGGFKNPSLPA